MKLEKQCSKQNGAEEKNKHYGKYLINTVTKHLQDLGSVIYC